MAKTNPEVSQAAYKIAFQAASQVSPKDAFNFAKNNPDVIKAGLSSPNNLGSVVKDNPQLQNSIADAAKKQVSQVSVSDMTKFAKNNPELTKSAINSTTSQFGSMYINQTNSLPSRTINPFQNSENGIKPALPPRQAFNNNNVTRPQNEKETPPALPQRPSNLLKSQSSIQNLSSLRYDPIEKFSDLFKSRDVMRCGVLRGGQVKPIWENSLIDKSLLSKTWDLADIDKDDALNLKEFCIGMYLIDNFVEHGVIIPDRLPIELEQL
jgi:hypothetical protein